ncbi:RDD family protein [Actinomadura yumaensis]|uniref:RDD family protein n=1 Tax=Actinomadura yumaensis TaxID=111807 RepID=UPI00360FE96C
MAAPPGADRPAPPDAPVLAEPGQRLLARIVDTLLVGLPVVMVVREVAPRGDFDVVAPPAVAALLFVYEAVQLAVWGRTLGKRFAGIEVVRADALPAEALPAPDPEAGPAPGPAAGPEAGVPAPGPEAVPAPGPEAVPEAGVPVPGPEAGVPGAVPGPFRRSGRRPFRRAARGPFPGPQKAPERPEIPPWMRRPISGLRSPYGPYSPSTATISFSGSRPRRSRERRARERRPACQCDPAVRAPRRLARAAPDGRLRGAGRGAAGTGTRADRRAVLGGERGGDVRRNATPGVARQACGHRRVEAALTGRQCGPILSIWEIVAVRVPCAARDLRWPGSSARRAVLRAGTSPGGRWQEISALDEMASSVDIACARGAPCPTVQGTPPVLDSQAAVWLVPLRPGLIVGFGVGVAAPVKAGAGPIPVRRSARRKPGWPETRSNPRPPGQVSAVAGDLGHSENPAPGGAAGQFARPRRPAGARIPRGMGADRRFGGDDYVELPAGKESSSRVLNCHRQRSRYIFGNRMQFAPV